MIALVIAGFACSAWLRDTVSETGGLSCGPKGMAPSRQPSWAVWKGPSAGFAGRSLASIDDYGLRITEPGYAALTASNGCFAVEPNATTVAAMQTVTHRPRRQYSIVAEPLSELSRFTPLSSGAGVALNILTIAVASRLEIPSFVIRIISEKAVRCTALIQNATIAH